MRKNVLVYSNCSGIAEKLSSFCVGEEIEIHKLAAGQRLEWQAYCTGIHLILLDIYARIKSQLRRYTQMTAICSNIEKVFRIDGLEVDDAQRMVTVNDREVRLTATEYKILQLLVKEKGKVFSGDEIYEAVWGMRPIGVDNTIAVHIRHIRKKIEEDPARPHYLKVAWGKGYMVG